ncbi:MAG: DUF6288 domain-containing protein [Planctomycetota bacterium]|nr:DUF6288 domain-containing protein [Planctomycetota bacterium]
MKTRSIVYSFLFAMAVLCDFGLVAGAAEAPAGPPDLTKGGQRLQGGEYILGPTGLSGWMYVKDGYTNEARQIQVLTIDKGSPADGVVQINDVILGVGGKLFAADARRAFGLAIGEAEKEENKGILKLTVWRKGSPQDIELKLKVMGAYSDTAPYDCPKSKKILEEGCRYIAKSKMDHRCKVAYLALLASGNPEYSDLIKTHVRSICAASNKEFLITHWVEGQPGGWTTGYIGVLLAEYYLATKDEFVLPEVRKYAHFIALGQSGIGTWASNMAWTDLNGGVVHGNLPGYGALNQAGLVCHMALVLAKKCGVKDPEVDQALARANRFFSYYVGKGCVPYGDHQPEINVHDDNGKCSEAAIAFDLQDMKRESQFFSKMAVAALDGREWGHTGNLFGYQWAGLGAARGGPKAAAAMLKELRWYYDLMRRWDGSFAYQGEGGGWSAGGVYCGWDSTTSYMLTFALPLRKIYLTGKDQDEKNWLSDADVKEAVAAGRFDPGKASVDELFKALGSWSPAMRLAAAEELAKRGDDLIPRLTKLVEGDDANTRIGACQALGALKERGAPAVPVLARLLSHKDSWLRTCAGDALASIGEPAKAVVPDKLKACAAADPEDPRAFLTRGLAFSLFYPGGALGKAGLLGKSIDGVDRDLLYPAVRQVVRNDDGRARGCMRSTYPLLTPEDIKALAPDIIRSIAEKAPSGEMFAGGVRWAGVKMLAQHHVKEGIPLCFTAMDWRNWGGGERIAICLDALKLYGGNALPVLKEIEREWTVDEATANSMKPQLDRVRAMIKEAQNDKNPPKLVSLKDLGDK